MERKNGGLSPAEKLELNKKVALLTGRDFWTTQDYSDFGIPSVRFSDGPNGLRVQAGSGDNFGLENSLPATCFPCSCLTACSWDRELLFALGQRLGREAAWFKVDVLLGPGVNIKRNPLCGRNFEYFSEDPYLAGELAAQYIRGVQSVGVSCCVKHFAVNNREWARTVYDVNVSERALREIYLAPFEAAVEGGVRAVMTSYNKLNGVYCSENEGLISGILRGEWGFDGIVISDWVGTSDRVAGVKAGEDIEMPRCRLTPEELLSAVSGGKLSEEQIDACVNRIAKFANLRGRGGEPYDAAEHLAFARRAAAAGAVLLKKSRLPLERGAEIAVIGALAGRPHIQGAGSARVNSSADDVLECLGAKFSVIGYERGYRSDGKRSKGLIRRAVRLARRAKNTVLFIGLGEQYDAEGADRENLFLPPCQTELIAALAAVGVRPVAVLCAGGVVDAAWDGCVSDLLHMHLAGAGMGGALASVLCGEEEPGGRLAESYPLRYEDVPCARSYAADPFSCEYKEDIFVGYRYYDAADIAVKYPFGFGLSYACFEYSDLRADCRGVRFTLTNTAARAGTEVAQLYLSPPDCGFAFPVKKLIGFEKVRLEAGESREIYIPMDKKCLRAYDENAGKWRIFAGQYGLHIGSSSRDIRLSAQIYAEGDAPENCGDGLKERESILRAVREDMPATAEGRGKKRERRVIDMHSPLIWLKDAKGAGGRLIYAIANFYCTSKKQRALLTFRYITVRSVAQYAGFNGAQAQGFIDICNGKFFRGLKRIITKKL